MKILKKYKNIILILIVTCILLLPLFTQPRLYGHDTVFHTANIIELSKTISLKNIFGSKLVTFNTNIFGYGTWLFYPKLPHLLASYLYLIFNNVYTSMNIIYFITTFLSGIFMFLLSKKIFNNKNIALISSLIYLTFPYHLTEIYVRDAYAENFMFLVAPLIFLGLYHLKDGEYKKFYLAFITGYVIGMHSHLISMVFCTIFVAIFILYYYKSFFNKEKIKAMLLSTLIVTSLSLPFLITIIEHKLLNIYTVFLSDTFANRLGVTSCTLSLKSYFSRILPPDNLQTYLNYVTLILFIITTIQLIVKKNKNTKKYSQLLFPIILFIIIVINLISSKTIWENIPEFFISIQFPWRLLVFLALFVSLYSPACLLYKFKIKEKTKNIIFCLLIIFLSIEGITSVIYYGDIMLPEEAILNSNLAMGYQKEYLPLITNKSTSIKYWKSSYAEIRQEGIISEDINVAITIVKDEFPNLIFKIDNLKGKTTIELPRVYYLGYTLKDSKGKKIELKNNIHGFLETEINKEGKYTLTYSGTKIEKIASAISILTIIGCVIISARRVKNEK